LTLESPDVDAVESSYLQAGAALAQANANLAKAQSDYDRANDLFQHNAIARKEVINAENAMAQAKAAVEQANASREQYSRRLLMFGIEPGKFGQQVEVRSPLAGKVLELNVAAGEYRNDTNAQLMTIANLSTVWVSADVPESSIRLVQAGERVDITLAAYPNEMFRDASPALPIRSIRRPEPSRCGPSSTTHRGVSGRKCSAVSGTPRPCRFDLSCPSAR